MSMVPRVCDAGALRAEPLATLYILRGQKEWRQCCFRGSRGGYPLAALGVYAPSSRRWGAAPHAPERRERATRHRHRKFCPHVTRVNIQESRPTRTVHDERATQFDCGPHYSCAQSQPTGSYHVCLCPSHVLSLHTGARPSGGRPRRLAVHPTRPVYVRLFACPRRQCKPYRL